LRRRCDVAIDRLELPQPFSAAALCAAFAASRTRPLHLHPHPFPDGTTTGLCVSTDRADHIFYEAHTAALHQEHIILHELGHLLCGHPVTPPKAEHELSLPSMEIDPTRVFLLMKRTGSPGEVEELAAELFAELVLDRARRTQRRHPVPEGDETLTRVRAALGG
jgi:hypothetical protein